MERDMPFAAGTRLVLTAISCVQRLRSARNLAIRFPLCSAPNEILLSCRTEHDA